MKYLLWFVLIVGAASGWDSMGHYFVVTSAFEQLPKDQRILFERVLAFYFPPKPLSLYEAANWADRVKRTNHDMSFWYGMPSWHYRDLDIELSPAELIELLENEVNPTLPGTPISIVGALWQAVQTVGLLPPPKLNPSSSDASLCAHLFDQARAFLFVLHLIADEAMPLHACSRKLDSGGGIDMGGLRFMVRTSWGPTPLRPLHFVWDGLHGWTEMTETARCAVGNTTSSADIPADVKHADDEPLSESPSSSVLVRWFVQAHALCIPAVYSGLGPEGAVLDASYTTYGRRTAVTQLERAAARLAAVLRHWVLHEGGSLERTLGPHSLSDAAFVALANTCFAQRRGSGHGADRTKSQAISEDSLMGDWHDEDRVLGVPAAPPPPTVPRMVVYTCLLGLLLGASAWLLRLLALRHCRHPYRCGERYFRRLYCRNSRPHRASLMNNRALSRHCLSTTFRCV